MGSRATVGSKTAMIEWNEPARCHCPGETVLVGLTPLILSGKLHSASERMAVLQIDSERSLMWMSLLCRLECCIFPFFSAPKPTTVQNVILTVLIYYRLRELWWAQFSDLMKSSTKRFNNQFVLWMTNNWSLNSALVDTFFYVASLTRFMSYSASVFSSLSWFWYLSSV